MKIIDAHNHPDWHGHDLTRFLANMDENGISQTWLLNWECGPHEASPRYGEVVPAGVLGSTTGPIPFTRCLSYLERAPERFILGYCPDPRLPDAVARLKAAHQIYGARVCGELKCRMMYDNPDAIRLFRAAGELKMPVTFHLQYEIIPPGCTEFVEWWGGTIDTIERVLQQCPDTIFLGHAPGFWIHISGDELYRSGQYAPENTPVRPGGRLQELLDRYPNLCCDLSAGSGLSALSRDPVHAKEFLTRYRKRVLYARDYFDGKHRAFLDGLGLPDEVLADLYAGNAERLLAEYR